MNWILFGFKGVGKTYFGSRLQRPFIDTDALMEKEAQMPIRQIYQERGEEGFRKLEQQVITSVFVSNHVIAVGGGAVLDSMTLSHLQSLGSLIYLQADKKLIKQRQLTLPLPAFIDPDQMETSFAKVYSTRILKYEKIPAYRIHVGSRSDAEILEELWQVINSAPSFESPPGESLTAKPLEL